MLLVGYSGCVQIGDYLNRRSAFKRAREELLGARFKVKLRSMITSCPSASTNKRSLFLLRNLAL